MNSDVCALSMMEAYVSGIEYKETFMHRLISPCYNINENVLSEWIKIITIALCLVSMYRLYYSQHFRSLLSSIKTNGLLDRKTLEIFAYNYSVPVTPEVSVVVPEVPVVVPVVVPESN
jgi:hypothetical protein